MSQQTYLKVPFVWEEPKPLINIFSRLEFKAARTLNYEVLLSVVARVMESSIDASDRKQVVEDGLEEATIYYIGVLPEYRGRGFATDLLSKGTRVLQDVGVWRVFCDTDANNLPMISTFKRVGYQQYGEPYQRPL